MSSVISGYEYDIFISYRQKDNKYDGWVTEFVENLKRELEATFKEEVNVYFDINPHDGILETYNVQASLNEKLKCLVFIPIISQTYCDPKSFAWQNEFLAFNKLAQNDTLGREIKLNNGNVASRILPVQIHNLDEDDKALLEKELGGPVRAIEFIYRESGVNRPLTPADNPDKNQEKTFYRDQINKIANAIKAIITSLKNPVTRHQNIYKSEPLQDKSKLIKHILIISILLIVILIISIYLIPGLISPGKEDPENSIAVLYFDNISNEPDQEYFSDGITDEITAHLSLIKGLRVTSRTSAVGFGIGAYRGAEENAVRLLKKAILLDPDFSQAYVLLSQIYFESTYTKLDSAIYFAKEAIVHNPKLPDGYIALSKTQDINNAIKTLRRLCDVDSSRGLLGMGNIYSLNAEFPKAIQCYKRVVKLDSNLYESYLGIAYVYYYLAQQDSVDKYIGLANKVAPDSKDIIDLSFSRFLFSGTTDAVIVAARKYYGDDTLNFNYAIGISYLFERDWKNAERFYLKTNYRDMDWGLLMIKTGRIDSGIKILRQSLSFRGTDGWAGDMSRINAVLGNKTKAISEFKLLLSSGWYDLTWIRNDPYWDVLREDDQFKKIIGEVEQRNVKMLQQIRENKYSALKSDSRN